MNNLSFEVERDFVPIALLASAPNIIIASPNLGVSSIHELIVRAKRKRVTYSSPGVGSQFHLAMELLKEKMGVDIVHAPYRSSSEALGDVLGGHIDIVATNLPGVLSAIRSKSVVPLAMTTLERSALAPSVPTLAELEVSGIDITSCYGLLAPKAIPVGLRDALFTITKDALTSPELREKLTQQGLYVAIESPDVFAERIKRETALWAGIIKSRNINTQP